MPAESSFEFVSHTADIAVRLRGVSREGLFEAAAAAMTEALTEPATVRGETARHVELAGPELELLLVDWLDELLFLFETEGFLVRDAEVEIARSDSMSTSAEDEPQRHTSERHLRDEYVLSAALHGETRDPARHRLKLLIKGVTYHGLHIARTAEGYEATVIFDI